jgi:PTH1 family peptidyl-tRNA hydrolase
LGVAPDYKVKDGADYVLTPFRKSQLKIVDEIVGKAADAVKAILAEGPAAAMNRFNRKETEEA